MVSEIPLGCVLLFSYLASYQWACIKQNINHNFKKLPGKQPVIMQCDLHCYRRLIKRPLEEGRERPVMRRVEEPIEGSYLCPSYKWVSQ